MPSETTLGGWLLHVMRRADGALSLEEALHAIMDSTKAYFPCQSIAVILIDEETKELRIKISRQISYTFVKKFRQQGPSPLAEQVVLEQHAMLFNRLDPASPRYAELKLEHELNSAVLAPVVRNQRGIGYIFADRGGTETFDEADLLHLQVLGYLVGNLIERFDLVRASKTLSQIDDATQALQYKAFVPLLATELQRAQTHDYPVTLALFSFPIFRTYVELHGIDAAHALLAEAVKVIKACIRDMDFLARFTADELVLCLSGTNGAEAATRLQDLGNRIRTQVVGRGDRPVQPVIGALVAAGSPASTHPVQDLLVAAGKALVEAKTGEGNPVVVHHLV